MPAQTSETLVISFSGEHRSGRRLFDGLLEANSTSFWNKPFMDAMSSLKYTGFVRPSTLFVTAPSHQLELIRAAYAKRMLKSLPRVSIASLGDMGCIRPVQQLPFVPLADAFLDGVAALNRIGRAATLSSVLDQIVNQCTQLDAPNHKMLSTTMDGLVEEGLICKVGQHMFVTPAASKTTVECQTGESMIVPPPPKKEGILARLFTRKVASPCKGMEKKEKRSPLMVTSIPQPSSMFADWECKGVKEEKREFRPPVYSTRPRTSRHHKRREDRHHRQQYRNPSSDEDNQYPIYPTTNYGPIDPPESIERFHREKKNQMNRHSVPMPSSVPIPSRARASTPTSSDSAYSRSVSEQSDNDDHTYVNLRNASELEETQFEECTLWNGPSTPIVTCM